MRVTRKGQVTIPKHIREKLGLGPESEIGFKEEKGRIYLVKEGDAPSGGGALRKFRGIASVNMTTNEIMKLTRGMDERGTD